MHALLDTMSMAGTSLNQPTSQFGFDSTPNYYSIVTKITPLQNIQIVINEFWVLGHHPNHNYIIMYYI